MGVVANCAALVIEHEQVFVTKYRLILDAPQWKVTTDNTHYSWKLDAGPAKSVRPLSDGGVQDDGVVADDIGDLLQDFAI